MQDPGLTHLVFGVVGWMAPSQFLGYFIKRPKPYLRGARPGVSRGKEQLQLCRGCRVWRPGPPISSVLGKSEAWGSAGLEETLSRPRAREAQSFVKRTLGTTRCS